MVCDQVELREKIGGPKEQIIHQLLCVVSVGAEELLHAIFLLSF